MESQNMEFRIDSQEDIAQQNKTLETEDDSQGTVVSDKEQVKEMGRDESGTGDMRNMMQIVLMRMEGMQRENQRNMEGPQIRLEGSLKESQIENQRNREGL